ncbi:MAG: hypothetical protein A4E70_01794 [Syntrophus sp. PtaU1.Bin005]|jgi:hypothetical protein|nr:MAG: hypothetical protein A4E69_01337 [Syntrophus sp. PtaB.Bin138]OPY80362.1 MAG: hypothetical protein A4E70_01794 [Syntrophus sp. PtaU1.Bin005]
MCGRFVLLTDLSVISESFDVEEVVCDDQRGNDILRAATISEGKTDR